MRSSWRVEPARACVPYTTVLPKPLMPVGDRPVLDIVLRQLRAAGCEHVTIATGYLAELIEAVCGNGDDYGVKIDYFRETRAARTVGALASIDGLDEPFLVMNGDVLTDMCYTALIDDHVAMRAPRRRSPPRAARSRSRSASCTSRTPATTHA